MDYGLRQVITGSVCLALQLGFIAALARPFLARKSWLLLLLLCASLSPGASFQDSPGLAGVASLAAVWSVHRALKSEVLGRAIRPWLAFAGVIAGGVACQHAFAAACLLASLLAFGLLHVFLAERESAQLARRDLRLADWFPLWLKSWGVGFVLPALLALIAVRQFPVADFPGRFGGDGMAGPDFGYFHQLHAELAVLFQPENGLPVLLSVLLALRLFIVGCLPVAGILGVGYFLPNRFLYRILQVDDHRLLLLWMSGTALVFATFRSGASASIIELGGIAFLLGAIAIERRLRRFAPSVRIVAGGVMAVLLLAIAWAEMAAAGLPVSPF